MNTTRLTPLFFQKRKFCRKTSTFHWSNTRTLWFS